MALSAFGWHSFRRATHRGFANLGRLLPTYLIAALGYWAFSTPPQIHEVYAIIALDAERFRLQISLGFASLVLLAITIWLSGGVALRAARGRTAVSHLLWRLSVCAAAILPILGLAAGVLEASTSFDVRQLHQTLDALGGIREVAGTSPLMSVPDSLAALKFENARYFDWAIATSVLLALVLFLIFFFAEAHSRERAGARSALLTRVEQYAIGLLLIAGLLLSGVFCLQGLATLDPPRSAWLVQLGSRTVDLSRALGIVTLISIFLGTALLVISYAIGVYRKFGIPLLLVLALSAALASANDMNDNHDLRLLPAPHGNLNFISEHFDKWFKERETYSAARFADRPFPVYVVAARGGGIYAANHAALFLARLRDTCPAFVQHLFAVSAVSGGSLGAAVYSGLARQVPIAAENADQCSGIFEAPGEMETLARRYLANGYLEQ